MNVAAINQLMILSKVLVIVQPTLDSDTRTFEYTLIRVGVGEGHPLASAKGQ